MKRILSLATLSLSLLSATTFAANSLPFNKENVNFAPVTWEANFKNGGFHFQNQTDKAQYVQVTITKGRIAVFTEGVEDQCHAELNAEDGPFSVVCVVPPNKYLDGDIDFADFEHPVATGTYQVEMDKSLFKS